MLAGIGTCQDTKAQCRIIKHAQNPNVMQLYYLMQGWNIVVMTVVVTAARRPTEPYVKPTRGFSVGRAKSFSSCLCDTLLGLQLREGLMV